MHRKPNSEEHYRIIQGFLQNIQDEKMRIACLMYMNRATDREVRKQLNISQGKLENLKLQVAFELKKAGIRL